MSDQHSYTYDNSTNLKVSAAETSSGAEALIVDLGGTSYTEMDLVLDVTEIERGDADETYDVNVQFSSSATFASDVVPGPSFHFGEELGTGGSADDGTVLGRMCVRMSNQRLGVNRRYVRLDNVIGGTTPSITYSAFLSKL